MKNLMRGLIVVVAATLFGGLVLVVGAAQAYQQSASVEKQAVGALQAPKVGTYEQTYFVGNLTGFRNYQVEQSEGNPRINADMIMEGAPPDLAPLVELIRSCIAPGTWKADAADPNDSRIGSVIPTVDKASLVIRHTAEVHEQLADLLRNLRTIVKTAVGTAVDRVAPGTSKAPIYVKLPSLPKDAAQAKGVAPRGGNESQSERRKRVRQLLQQLQAELEAMDSEGTTLPNHAR